MLHVNIDKLKWFYKVRFQSKEILVQVHQQLSFNHVFTGVFVIHIQAGEFLFKELNCEPCDFKALSDKVGCIVFILECCPLGVLQVFFETLCSSENHYLVSLEEVSDFFHQLRKNVALLFGFKHCKHFQLSLCFFSDFDIFVFFQLNGVNQRFWIRHILPCVRIYMLIQTGHVQKEQVNQFVLTKVSLIQI